MSKTVTILYVDRDAREVHVMDLNEWTQTFAVANDVAVFDFIRAGDEINIQFNASIALEMRAPNSDEEATPFRTHSFKTIDGQPTQTITAVCKISAIDRDANMLTLRGPAGRPFKIKVANQHLLRYGQIGNAVVVNYTQGVIIAMSRVD